MNISNYIDLSVVDGEGTRCVLFVSGCNHKCKGCYNKSTWNPKSGYEFTKEMEDRIIADLKDTRIKRRGITLSGGDPLHFNNRDGILALCRRIKQECSDKDIWLYTGYTLECLKEMENMVIDFILGYVDVLVDGKFEQELKDPGLKFRGSSNQRIIYMGN